MQEPMYIKIHNQIKRDIENKKYKVGERIPAERQLALKFNVSRMTLRSLYQTLEKKGGYKIGSVVENIGASVANENEARLLSVKKGEPLVTRRQVTELNDHYPFEYVRASYVAERFEFTFEK